MLLKEKAATALCADGHHAGDAVSDPKPRPIIALLLAFVCTLHLHVFTRRNLLIVAALALVLARFSS
jgi:uncharacterized membrane protein YhhN